MSSLPERYDLMMMSAYIRGALKGMDHPLLRKPLPSLTEEDCAGLLDLARDAGLKTHHFKRFEELPRVRMVLGFLRAVQPESLLDVGSGRGVFLFPFLRAFPRTPVTSLERLDRRADMLRAIHDGGMDRLTALKADICLWNAPDASFDVVTMLEVLEHIPDAAAAVRSALRLARRYVVLTVPSRPDNNPEHIHLFTKDSLSALFHAAGPVSLRFDGVPGHLFMTAKKEEKGAAHE